MGLYSYFIRTVALPSLSLFTESRFWRMYRHERKFSSSIIKSQIPYQTRTSATYTKSAHICFAVDDIEAEVAKLRANGFKTRNEIMDFHSRKLVFIDGPEGITVELAEWH